MALYTVNPTAVVSPADVNQFTNLLNGTTAGVQITNAARIRAQATGATSGGGGYCGQVAGAAPTSGNFVAGDFVHDGVLGTIWVCTTGGTPGIWSALPSQISTVNLGTTSSSVTFASIPAFNHIEILWQARDNSGNLSDNLLLRLNGDSGSNYGSQSVSGQNTTASAAIATIGSGTSIVAGIVSGGTATAGYYAGGKIEIPGWATAASGHQATVIGTGYIAATTASSGQIAGTYGGTYNPAAALTSLTLLPASGQFVSGSTFTIYGLM